MRLERHGVAHILTLLGQSHQRPTTFVALEFGWAILVGIPVDGMEAHRGIAVAVMARSSRVQQAARLLIHSQSALKSKSVLASQQALLENMGFHPGD